MTNPSFNHEALALQKGYHTIVGVDEVGRGPWAGPVVAAAVIISPDLAQSPLLSMIQDSKTLSSRKRDAIWDLLKDAPEIVYSLGSASVEEIDTLNILQATFLAMQRAVEGLGIIPDFALVDGNRAPKLKCPSQTIVKGDQVSLSIAAASIIAKVHRDELMSRLAQDYPPYQWERNAGYGTAAHQQALHSFGVTPHHRQSFAPISALLKVSSSFA